LNPPVEFAQNGNVISVRAIDSSEANDEPITASTTDGLTPSMKIGRDSSIFAAGKSLAVRMKASKTCTASSGNGSMQSLQVGINIDSFGSGDSFGPTDLTAKPSTFSLSGYKNYIEIGVSSIITGTAKSGDVLTYLDTTLGTSGQWTSTGIINVYDSNGLLISG
jgi:hypothetical protein